ncbi:hypothetical protein AGDE_03332 [Angomonas deanei]|nr:hypothetical protein AGDE_03332 [Angomonas deanei]|eukprot:EPY40596.1 hypothetical protein AGDE_03332 [Angomonas deanei]
MHFLVHEIKDAEQELAEREDMDARLQRESLAWAEEEHALRTKLNQLQQQEKQQRKKQQAELAELESQLAEAEKALAHDRSTRVTDMKEKARSIIRSSRPPSPSNKAQANFVTSHVAGGVPTRSCVRTAPTSRATSQNLTGEDGLPLQGNTLDQMRAYSYGANKQSRKRTLLGDATNQQ